MLSIADTSLSVWSREVPKSGQVTTYAPPEYTTLHAPHWRPAIQPQIHQAHRLWFRLAQYSPFHIMQNSTPKSLATQQSITVQFSPGIKQIMPKKVLSASDPTAKAITLPAVEMNVRQLGKWQVFKWHICVVTTWHHNFVWQQLGTVISHQVISLTPSLSFHVIHTCSLWSASCIYDSLAVRSPGNSGVSLLMPRQLETWNWLKDVTIYTHELRQILIQALDFKSLLQCFHFMVPQ